MNEGRSVFAQIMDLVPKYEFAKCVARYGGDCRVRTLRCYEQFLIMAFAQLTYRESLRDIQTCLQALSARLYHCGIRSRAARSTLADANEKRDWRIFRDFAQVLIGQATALYDNEDLGFRLREAAYALDSSLIELCRSMFPWAKYRRTRGGIKLHTLLTLRGSFPTVIILSSGKVHDLKILDELTFEAGAFYILDRGYYDFKRLHRIEQDRAFFVTRAKKKLSLRRRYSHVVAKRSGVRFDQTVVVQYSRGRYPAALRRVGYRDPRTGKSLEFLTNNFHVPALTIARLYKSRWQIELFFRWIKQHLRIKAFYGTSENAVHLQIWIAIAVYVLIAIMRKRLRLQHSPYEILQILSLTLFEKVPLLQVFAEHPPEPERVDPQNQQCFQGF